MSTAAEWANISPFAPSAADDVHAIGATTLTNLSWSQQRDTIDAAPVFGGRRQWSEYTFETTGYGSIELAGPLAHRVTIVHPGDAALLRRHHRQVRHGRLRPSWHRGRGDAGRLHVVDREELRRTRADAGDSWLFAAQAVARLCGTDDEVARLAGPALRHLLWSCRDHLDAAEVAATFVDLRRATEDLATERTAYLTTLERWVRGAAADRPAHVHSVRRLAQDDVESMRREARVLAEIRHEWDDAHRAI